MKLDDQLQTIFVQSASEVLETMFFVGVLGETSLDAAADLVSAELTFRGQPSGRFGVQVPPSTGKLITSNFLGKDEEEVTAADVGQVVCELTNMICGSVLSRVEAEARFELLHPALTSGEATSHPKAIVSTLELEQGSILLWMTIDETASTAPAFQNAPASEQTEGNI